MLAELRRMGVVLKRAQYFIRTSDWPQGAQPGRETTVRALIDPKVYSFGMEQLSLFQDTPGVRPLPTARDVHSITEAVEETVLCLASSL
jgi:hypothetical protein